MEHPAYSQLRQVTDSIGVVLCPNPGYSSLEGTNSWIIRGAEDSVSVVVDPGPEDEGHLNVLQQKAGEIALVLITHRHHDHADSIDRFRQLTGAPVRGFDPTYCRGGEPLKDGEIITLPGLTPQIEVVHTPGHTNDCVCFFVWSGEAGNSTLEGILTGDTIAGRHTTMISETDGDLGAYIDTLHLLEERGKGVTLLPAHGPEHADTAELAHKYVERREHRLDQVKQARAKLGDDASIEQLVNEIYTDVDPVLRGAAAQSTRVAVRYLDSQK